MSKVFYLISVKIKLENLIIDFLILEIPPPYEEAIKIKSDNNSSQNPIRSISLSIDQGANSTSI